MYRGAPRLRPSSITHALHSPWLDMYPHRPHVPARGQLTCARGSTRNVPRVGIFTLSLTPSASPERMMSAVCQPYVYACDNHVAQTDDTAGTHALQVL